MGSESFFQLTACDAADRLASGAITSRELVESCLERIAVSDPEIEAWAFLDPDHVRQQALAADRHREAGGPLGGLHGLPIGVKDIIDVEGMPCENGTRLDAGRRPKRDSHIASMLRAAGAVIVGKTVTTELAFYHPGKTRNPRDREHTPGGSSSGSAAAVADGMVPLAIGSQTNGSMIRPASFCGVVGFKPTYGTISRSGVLALAPALDTIGVFARAVQDCALLVDALGGFDAADEAMRPAPRQRLLETCLSEPPVDPKIAFVKSPAWKLSEPPTQEGFVELTEAFAGCCEEVQLPDIFLRAADWHRMLMTAEMARHLRAYEFKGGDHLSEVMRATLKDGRAVSAVDYQEARDAQDVLNGGLEAVFDRYDAIITPAAAGEAPKGLRSTGDPSFATLWTYCGLPALSLPLMEGPNGLPVGVQVVGRRGDDARVLRTARWIAERSGEVQ